MARSDKRLQGNPSGLFGARTATCAGRFLLERYRHHPVPPAEGRG